MALFPEGATPEGFAETIQKQAASRKTVNSSLINVDDIDGVVHKAKAIDGYRESVRSIVQAATLEDINRLILKVMSPDNYVFVEAGVVGK